ncbi:GNAT family N-acetyltransferase [Thalassospira sp. TSL5-1]|uniref:GNAT family N-acetyltransferase n=1 Tax=Thalassospira sp. TSL5-1 TaxID=1544451 RepID=UPI000B0DDDF8|nr:GNAT family N-acetyltransferase [Thalassospira sp. TSL5-1]
MNIRPAIKSDVDAVFAIRLKVRENALSLAELTARGITRGAWHGWFNEGYGIWVAQIGDDIAGFAIAVPKEATLWALFVDPDFEGRGVGSALLKVAEDWLFDQGCQEISLTTDANPNVRAHGFYERHGWTLTGDADDGQVEYIKGRVDGADGFWSDEMLDRPV